MKPFRVTNEQIKIDLMLYDDDIECAKYAADLLDSRELIDKQEALIKEMRKYFEDLSYNSNYPTQILTMVELEKLTNINHQTALLFLEKTKDYA